LWNFAVKIFDDLYGKTLDMASLGAKEASCINQIFNIV
jgi:hypothetical protein